MNNCPKCGFPVTMDETECSNCGEPVENKDNLEVSPENEEEQIIDTAESIDSEVVDDEPEITTIGLDDESEIEDISEIIPVAELNSVEEESMESEILEEEQDMNDSKEEVEELEPIPEPIPVIPDVLPEAEELPVEALEVENESAVPVETTSDDTLMPVTPDSLEPVTPDALIPQTPDMLVSEQVPMTSDMLMPESPEQMPMAPDALMPESPEQVPTVPDALIPQPVDTLMPVTPDLNMTAPEQMAPVPAPGVEMGMPLPETIPEPVKEVNPELKALKFKKITFVIVILISLVALGLTVFFMNKIISNNNQNKDTGISEKAKEYHYEGFSLYIEDEYNAEIYEGEMYIGDTDGKWSALMTLQTGTYNNLVSNKSQLVDYFKEMGYETTEPTEKEISGTAFVKMEVMMGSKNILVAYAKANGTKLFGIVLENESGDYSDDEWLRPIGNILSTMKYNGPTYSLPDGFQLDSFIETFNVAE